MTPNDDEELKPYLNTPQAQAIVSNATGMALGITGLVIGTLSLLLSFVPCVGAVALYPAVLGAILSVIGLLMSVRSKGLPIAGIVLSLLAAGIAYWQGTRAEEAIRQGAQNFQKNLDTRPRDTTK